MTVLIAWVIIVYLPFAMRSWPSLIALCIGFLLIAIGIKIGVAIFSSDDVPGILVLTGNFWKDALAKPLLVTVIARTLVLSTKSLGLSGRWLLVANIFGILALPGTVLGIAVYEKWDRRPAPLQCTNRPISLVLSGVAGQTTWNDAIILYSGDDIRNDSLFQFSARHQRRICQETSDGKDPLGVDAISLNLAIFSKKSCDKQEIYPWEQYVCDNWEDRAWRYDQNRLIIFEPGGIRPGDFGIPKTTTNNAYPAQKNERVVSVARPDGGTVTAVCAERSFSDGQLYCRMRRSLVQGLGFYWAASVPLDDLENSIRRTDGFANSVCSSVFEESLCGD